MRRFAYAPDVNAYIATEEYGFIDVSADIVSGSVTRRVNAVSNADLVLQNPNRKYLRKIKPMDRIVIYLTRIHKPVLVFSGYIDRAPFDQLFPGPVKLTASCTLKRLLHTYWDPGLPFVQRWLKEYGWTYDQTTGLMLDGARNLYNSDLSGGLGHMMRAVLKDIGGWPVGQAKGEKNTVHVMELPPKFIKKTKTLLANQLAATEVQQDMIDRLIEELLTVEGIGSGQSDGSTGTGGADEMKPVSNVKDSYPLGINEAKKSYTVSAYGEALIAAAPTTANAIDKYLLSKNSPLAGYGPKFMSAGIKYGVDPRLLIAIAGQESSFGLTGNAVAIKNAWGIGPHKSYASWDAGIDAAFYNIAEGDYYFKEGRYTINEIQERWAPLGVANDPNDLNANWRPGVRLYYKQQGGDPDGDVRYRNTNVKQPKARGKIGDFRTSNLAFFENYGGTRVGRTFRAKPNPFGDDSMIFKAVLDSEGGRSPAFYVPGWDNKGTPWAQEWKTTVVNLETSKGREAFSGQGSTSKTPTAPSGNFVFPVSGVASSSSEPSTKYDGRKIVASHGGHTPVRIVLHSTESGDSEGTSDISSIADYWAGNGFGAHLVIDSDGLTGRMIDDNKIGYHVSNRNNGSLGIEIVGRASFTREDWKGRQAQLDAVAQWIAYWCSKWNIPLRNNAEHGISTHATQYQKYGAGSDVRTDPGDEFPINDVLEAAMKLRGSSSVSLQSGQRYNDPRPGRKHAGVDLVGEMGTPLLACVNGTVVHNGVVDGGGHAVAIKQTGKKDVFTYMHLQSPSAHPVGAKVASGQIIGYMGNSGTSAVHLHFEWHVDGRTFGYAGTKDPLPLLQRSVIGTATVTDASNGTGYYGTTGVQVGQEDIIDLATSTVFGLELGFPAIADVIESESLTGSRALANDVPLFEWVEFMAKASGRSFQSMPNGDLFFFYPDYFNWSGKDPYFTISPIETVDLNIDISDEELTTHVFTTADTYMDGKITLLDKLASTVASVEETEIFQTLVNVENFDDVKFLQRYGARPREENRPDIKHSLLQFMYGWMTFLELWAKQFYAFPEFTFMPELFPGSTVEFKTPHDMQFYVQEVTHNFDRSSGFSTSASFIAPSTRGGYQPAMALSADGLKQPKKKKKKDKK